MPDLRLSSGVPLFSLFSMKLSANNLSFSAEIPGFGATAREKQRRAPLTFK